MSNRIFRPLADSPFGAAAHVAGLVLSAALSAHAAQPAPTAASAPTHAERPDAGPAIYQQRGADGRVLFTDRPTPGLATERRWRVDPAEDAASAAERREAGRAQAERVTERIQRSIDQRQALDNQLQIEQLRAQREADALAAERLRERDREYESRPYVVLPGRPWARPPVGQTRPSGRPATDDVKPVRPAQPMLRTGPHASKPGTRESER